MAKSYNKKVQSQKFHEGDSMLKKILPLPGQYQSKWAPNYEGHYMVKKAFSEEFCCYLERMKKI